MGERLQTVVWSYCRKNGRCAMSARPAKQAGWGKWPSGNQPPATNCQRPATNLSPHPVLQSGLEKPTRSARHTRPAMAQAARSHRWPRGQETAVLPEETGWAGWTANGRTAPRNPKGDRLVGNGRYPANQPASNAMLGEREKEQLAQHIREAEERAAAGGHDLGPWQPVSPTGLFSQEAVCTRCGGKVQVSYTALYVAFDRLCPGKPG